MHAKKLDHITGPPLLLRALIVEDNPGDAELAVALLDGGGYKVRFALTDSPESFREHLEAAEYDVILADYHLKQWTALDALEILRTTGKDIPLIVITGALGDEAATECIKRGAADFVLKDRPARLPIAVQQALEAKRLREECKRAEEVRRASEEHFRSFIKNAPVGIYSTTPQGRILMANPTLVRMLGYENFDELASCNLEEGEFNPDYARRDFREQIERYGEVKGLEARWTRRDGSVIFVRESARAVRGESGKVLYYDGIVEDITGRKRAEEALRESQALTSTIVDSTSDMIWSVDAGNFALLTFNRGLSDYFLEWCGVRLQIGTVPEDHFLDQGLVNRWRGLYQRALSEGPYTTEYNVTAGSSILQLTFNLLQRDGKVFGISVFGKNITERKRAEEGLRQSEAELREALLAAQMGVWEWTAASDTVTWDENLYRIAGRDPKLPAPSYEEHQKTYAPESWERLKVAVEKALATGTPYELDLELIRPDGSKRWLIARGGPMRDGSGCITRLRGTVQDITERKQAEEALRESEERFRTTFENAGIGMALVDLQGHPFNSNAALQQMLGYSEEELSRMIPPEFTHPDDLELDWSLFRELALGKREKYEIEKRFLKKGGTVVWGLLTGSLVKGRHGPPLYGVAMVQDISERKRAEMALQESEERYRRLFEVESDAIIIVDVETRRILDANAAALKLYGYSREEFRSLTAGEVSAEPEKTSAAIPHEWSHVPLRWHRKKDGTVFPVEITGNDFFDQGREIHVAAIRDITERKQAEEDLRASEARFRTLITDAPVAIGVARKGITRYVNTAYVRLFGLQNPEDAFGCPILDQFAPPCHDQINDILRRRHQGLPAPKEYESVGRRKDGSTFPMHVAVSRVELADGPVSLGFLTDLTERKRAEQELAMLKRSIDVHYDGAYWTDTDNRFIYLNDAACKALGYAREELMGKTILDINPKATPEGLKGVWESLRRQGFFSTESVHRRKDGSEFPVEIVVTYVQFGGKEFSCGFARDITERKRTEERFRELVETAEAIVWEADGAGQRITFVSQGAEKILGYPTDQWLQNPGFWAGLLHPEDREEALACEREVMEKGQPRSAEYRMQTADGRVLWFRDFMHAVSGPGGKVERLRGIMVDITESKRAEEALRQSEQRYKDFISHSHEGVWRMELEQPIPMDLPEDEALERLLEYGYIAECNLAFARILGSSTSEEVVGRRLRELISLPDQERLESYRVSIRAGWESRTVELRGRDQAGNLRHLLRTEIPIVENGMFIRAWGITRDITERTRAEEELRRSEARWRAVFENSAVGIALADCISTQFQAANLAFQKMVGYSEEELRTLTFMGITYEDDREPNRLLLSEVREGRRQSFAMEKRYRRRDGSLVWVNLHVSLVPGAGSIPRFFLAIVEDITERKRAEEALRHSEAQLREALSAAQMGVWEWTVETDTVTWDENLYRMAGRDPKLAAPNSLEQPRLYAPESWLRLKAGVENALATGSPYEIDLEMLRPDGSKRWLISRGEPRRDASGSITHLRGTVQDITERKRTEEALRASEERFRLFMNNSPTVAWVKDEQGRYVYISGAYEKRIDVRLEDQRGKTDFELYPHAIAEQFRKNDQAALHAGHPIEVIEESLSPQGKTWYWLSYKFPFHDASGRVFVAGIGSDITERLRMEKDLQDSLEQLRALAARLQTIREEERKRVAREIHDQLGQALTAIKIDLSALVRELPASAARQSKRTSSVLQLVDETIRSVRRISTELRPGILDDLGLVAAIEWAGEDFEARTGTTCLLDLPQEDIAVDPDRATAIFRIFQETLTNVARHAGASKVDVRMARADGDLTLEVHDNGKGITGDKLSSRESLGILGMRERAMLLGGELTISGPPGNGTTVRVRIPEGPRN
jgi:PAS domain S-box-containing protein